MSFLPLLPGTAAGLADGMPQNFLIRAARRTAAVLAECHQARRRCVTLALAPDRQLANPGEPPETYAEFLFRTSAPLLHEPPARDRARRHAALGNRERPAYGKPVWPAAGLPAADPGWPFQVVRLNRSRQITTSRVPRRIARSSTTPR